MSAGRLAVTGASGFLGRRVTRAAVAAGWQVTGLVRSRVEPVVEAGARAVRCALEAGALAPHFEGARALVHLANVGAEREGARYEAVNLDGTREVLRAARAAGVPRIVYVSGLGVVRYGASRHTTNRYFLSKLAAEVELFRSDRELAVLRPSWVIGPESALLAELLAQLEGGEVEIVAGGGARMQPVTVEDAAEACLAAAERATPWPLVVDVVGPEPLSQRELVERLARAAGAAPRLRSIPAAEAAARAATPAGYRGMGPEELDCLLCDEVAPAEPLAALLGRAPAGPDAVLRAAVARGRRG